MKRWLSRRAFLAAGGTGLLAVASAGFWRLRQDRSVRQSARAQSGSPVGYADHRGWMITADEKRTLEPPDAPAIP
jgi:hypothetical protein